MKILIRLFFLAAIVNTGACTKSNSGSASNNGGSPPNNNENNKSVGASAKELLVATKPKLVIEINYMPGYQLQPASVTNLVVFLKPI